MVTKELREQLFSLPADERRQLGEELLDSVEDEGLSPELKAALEQAHEEEQQNPNGGVPFEEVVARMRAREK